MQKHVNLVDLVKSFPTNIFLQNLASIQKRTSPTKFDHLTEKSEKGSTSNLSTKVRVGLTFLAGEGGKASFGHALLEQFGESLLATKAFVALEERTVAWLLQSAIAAQEDDVWASVERFDIGPYSDFPAK